MSVTEAAGIETGNKPAEILALQRKAFLRAGAPSLAERKDDITRLRAALKQEAEQIALVWLPALVLPCLVQAADRLLLPSRFICSPSVRLAC